MKKVCMMLVCASLLFACGGKSVSGKELGTQVCDCSEKANAMDAADPGRAKAQAECSKLQVESWDKVKDNQKEADAFNKVLQERLEALMKKNMGK